MEIKPVSTSAIKSAEEPKVRAKAEVKEEPKVKEAPPEEAKGPSSLVDVSA